MADIDNLNTTKLYCPIHGEIPEDQQLNSAGGKFCSVAVEDEPTCMQPLEPTPNGSIS